MHAQIHAKKGGLAEQQEHFCENQTYIKNSLRHEHMTSAGGSKTSGGKEKRSCEQGKKIREKWARGADVVAVRGEGDGHANRLAGFFTSEFVLSVFTELLCSTHSGTWGDFGLQAPPQITAAQLPAKPWLAKSHTQIDSHLHVSLDLD